MPEDKDNLLVIKEESMASDSSSKNSSDSDSNSDDDAAEEEIMNIPVSKKGDQVVKRVSNSDSEDDSEGSLMEGECAEDSMIEEEGEDE